MAANTAAELVLASVSSEESDDDWASSILVRRFLAVSARFALLDYVQDAPIVLRQIGEERSERRAGPACRVTPPLKRQRQVSAVNFVTYVPYVCALLSGPSMMLATFLYRHCHREVACVHL